MTRPQTIRSESEVSQEYIAAPVQQNNQQPSHLHSFRGALSHPVQNSEGGQGLSSEVEDNQHDPSTLMDWNIVERQQPINQNENEASISSSNYHARKSDTYNSSSSGNQIEDQSESIYKDLEARDAEVNESVDDDMIDRISSSPSIPDEDIDLELVFALHTFVATIEGQANVIKGDTMVLLDDTNSYWWLVRVVKDMTIGYLPAEHIETPSERLARLNKHRNIDLASKMLGDQSERHQNSLIMAFRKRSIKTVSFTDPTYIEASDVDYSTEEDEFGREFFGHMTMRDQVTDNQEKMDNKDENVIVTSPKPQSDTEEAGKDELAQDINVVTTDSEKTKTSNEQAEEDDDAKSRSGPHRNTDSFFQDDSVETRKITLTPNLLRDDSSSPPLSLSNEPKDQKLPSLDKTGKESPEVGKDKKERKEKKEKEKRPGMLSGLFKRKDRKNKSIDEDIDEILGMKQLNDSSQTSPEHTRDHDETQEDQTVRIQETKIQSSNLENQSGSGDSPLGDSSQSRLSGSLDSGTVDGIEPAYSKITSDIPAEEKSREEHGSISDSSASTSITEKSRNGNVPVEVTRIDQKPFKSNAVTSHLEIDNSTTLTDTTSDTSTWPKVKPSEAPIQTNSTNGSNANSQALVVDSSSQDEFLSPMSSASLESLNVKDLSIKPSTRNGTALATINNSWNDIHLKSFFENNLEVKDMLINVYDNTGVIPAGPEHPLTGYLFKEENVKLAEITNRLNGMLENWLDRKIRTKISRL